MVKPEFGLAVTGEMDGAGATGRNLGGGNDRVSGLLGCQPSRSLLEEPPSPGNDSSSVRGKTGSQAGTRLHCFHKVEGNGSRRKMCSQSLTSVSVSSSQPDTFLGAEETDGRRPFTPRCWQPAGLGPGRVMGAGLRQRAGRFSAHACLPFWKAGGCCDR